MKPPVENLNTLLKKYGLDPIPSFETGDVERVDFYELRKGLREEDRGELVKLYEHVGGKVWNLSGEIGTPGTQILDGNISMEPNPRYEPMQVRGYYGEPALYEKYGRSEPQIVDALTSIQEVNVAANREVQIPTKVKSGHEKKMEEFVDWCNGWIANLNQGDGLTSGGVDSYVEHGCTAAQFGFANFEVVWGQDRAKLWRPTKIAYREPATVEKWILSERQDHLKGALFRTGGSNSVQYMLSATGKRLSDHQLINIAMLRRGNNFEGISLIRPAIHWIKVKELIGQMIPITAQKWGAPRERVMADPGFLALAAGRGASNDDVKELVAILGRMGFGDTSHSIPDGLKVETDYPGAQMPSFKDILDYCDFMISLPWSNEGSLLGQQSVGSYALASVSDNKFMRAAMYINRKISEPIDALIRMMAIELFGEELVEYPYWAFRLDGIQDNSKWVDDIVKVFMAGVSGWPEEPRHAAAEKLGLSPTAFDSVPDREVENREHSCGSVELIEAPRDVIECAEFDAKKGERILDQATSRLARALQAIAREHKREFRRLTDGVTSAAQILAIRDTLRDQFQPRYIAAAKGEMEGVADKAKRQLLRDFGIRVGASTPLPQFDSDTLDLLAHKIGEDTYNRESGVMRDARIAQVRGEPRVDVDTLALATLVGIAGAAVSSAFNEGRESIIRDAIRRTPDPPHLTAVRSAVMDRNTCKPCERRNNNRYVVGSAAYEANKPPNFCEGGEMCRCVYIYEVSEAFRPALEEIARAA